jgi:prepilin-type N-terminal cleavage/methylation domain-containing protein
MSISVRTRCAARGFSMVELLVTIVLAGIIFAAMVPLFASALKKSAADNNRVLATNLAQERLEKVRLLRFADITATNLNSATIGPNWFTTTETPVGGKTYTINSAVDTDDPNAPYKAVIVDVTWSETTSAGVTAPHTTTMKTLVKNPAETIETTTTGGGGGTPGGNGPFTVTVSFKYWDDVDGSGQGVSIIRQVPTPVATLSPAKLRPTSSNHTVQWTGIPGGTDITYVVQCIGDHGTMTTPPFHLLSDITAGAPLKFDTDPGN